MAKVEELGCKKILLNAPASLEAAKMFLEKHGSVYSFSEYQMQWKPRNLPASNGFTLRYAEPEDTELRIRLDVDVFGVVKRYPLALHYFK